jgi:hypothetical protein
VTQQPSTFAFSGGLDLSTAQMNVAPGRLISCMNYESVAEGYRRCDGFERYDGRNAPSEAQFWRLPFSNGASIPSAGAVMTGTASGATGILTLPPQNVVGDWNSHATGDFILTNVVGDFADGEWLYVGGVLRAKVSGVALLNSGIDEDRRASYLASAQEHQRTLIQPVPGVGPVRGVAIYGGKVYALRDTASNTCSMWRAVAGGWENVSLGRMLRFTLGLLEISEGDRIYGATSGAAATAARVIRQSGSWGSTAAGYIILTDVTGAFQSESLTANGHPSATTTGDAAITIPPGGRYEFITHNFYGAANRQALYGAGGAGNAFEFMDGIFTPIETGMGAKDKPTRVFEIGNALGLCFPGGSIQISQPGEPLIWSVVLGASEIGLGTEITNVIQSNETAVAFFGEKKIAMLTGTSINDFKLEELTEEAGAYPWTAQRLGKTLYCDARGLRDLAATQAYGNFRVGSLMSEITPLFNAKKKAGLYPILSFVSRAKSQYRMIWNDGTGLSVFMGRKNPEPMEFSISSIRPSCVATGELDDGEGIFIGAEDGYVYRMDSGSSFDGLGVKGFVMTPFAHIGGARREKRLHKTSVEMLSAPGGQIGITVMFDYGDGDQPASGNQDFIMRGNVGHDFIVTGGGGLWDSALWDEFFWSAPLFGVSEADTEGLGVSFSAIIACDSHPAEDAHTLQSYTYLWSPRKLRR